MPVFKIGETASDKELKITVNSVQFKSVIDELKNDLLVEFAPEGMEYLILDLTFENLRKDETQTISQILSFLVKDQEGYDYSFDFRGFVALENGFKEGEVLPGMKKRGRTVFLVPKSATDLKFIYKFDFVGTTSVFDVK